ncbi:hypothetical protein DPMN_193146 [Dreissena polymorpha]|uniref:Uncharacterized protein n=1 Tax=Dreissena polymorpha TaxID=45954 RepID=A0A9D3Y660_DREPO|nr:hypothetical protein DPMN_193146 [Dreissena polymorpha]
MGKGDLTSIVSLTKDSNNLNKTQPKRIRANKRKVVSPDNIKLDKKSRLTTDTESEYESESTEGSSVDWFSPNYTFESHIVVQSHKMSNNSAHGDNLDSTLVDKNCANTQLSLQIQTAPQPSVHLTGAHDHHYVISTERQIPPYMTTSPTMQSTPIQMMPQSYITDFDLQRIVHTLRISLRDEIRGLVQACVAEHVTPLVNELSVLKQSVTTLTNKIADLEQDMDNANQYSRRHCVIVSNVPENSDESTDDIILNIAKESGSNIILSDIDRSHRNGPPKRNDGKHRDIIVKFTNYKAKSEFIKSR